MPPPPTVFRPGGRTDKEDDNDRPVSAPPRRHHQPNHDDDTDAPPPRRKHWPSPAPLPPAATHWPATAVQQSHYQPPEQQQQQQQQHSTTKQWQQALYKGPATANTTKPTPKQIDELLQAKDMATSVATTHKPSFAPYTTTTNTQKQQGVRKKAVGWNDHLFVVQQQQQQQQPVRGDSIMTMTPHPRDDNQNNPGVSLPPPRRRELSPPPPSSLRRADESFSSKRSEEDSFQRDSTLRKQPTPPVPLNRRRKQTLIVDKETRDTRWNWSRLLLTKTLEPYRMALCVEDDLLPDTDKEFQEFRNDTFDTDDDIIKVRDSMLDDSELTEREVAAFFEGFALFQMKMRSLQSQLDSMKALGGDTRNTTNTFRSMRAMSMMHVAREPRPLAEASLSRSQSGKRSSLMMAAKSSSESAPREFGKSLRALSIKKVQKEHGQDEKVQKLLRELEEAERKQQKLEKQLQQAGIVIAEDIPYDEAKKQVETIAKRLQEIGGSDTSDPKLREEYFKLEQDMEKYTTALHLTDEYIEEQDEMERKWEEDNAADNVEALKQIRRHMPVEVKSMSEAQLCTDPTPNGQVLPKAMARKFKRTNVLQLLRVNPEDIVRMHPSTLENLRVTGMTLTERRAMYAHLHDVGPRWKAMQADQMTERKWVWFQMMKQNFKENLALYQHHVEQYGPPGNHPYATRENPDEGCPMIGKQCPLKADKLIDYDGDYGYPDGDVYELSNVQKADVEDPGAKAKREALELARDKRANERNDALKKHYKGRVLQVSLANGSCEAMDEIMDRVDGWQTKWIEDRVHRGENVVNDDVKRKELTAFGDALNELKLAVLPFAERSGMQLTGKKDANAQHPDIRSPVELGLSEEVYDAAEDLFKGIEERMSQLRAKDSRLTSTISQMRELLLELHERNINTLKELGCECPEPTRKRRTREEIRKDAKANALPSEAGDEEQAGETVPSRTLHPMAAAIAARGQGHGPGDEGGRSNLMASIAGRGRGRGGGEGRGDLMAAIAGRGRGERGGPGRGGLMSEIAGRAGRGGRGGPGRGDLMAELAGRAGGGGRGDLMAAIAGRGQKDSQREPVTTTKEEAPAAPAPARKKPKDRKDFLASIGALGPDI